MRITRLCLAHVPVSLMILTLFFCSCGKKTNIPPVGTPPDTTGANMYTVATLAGDGLFGVSDGAGTSARFNTPHGVATDAAGNVYVADSYNNSIRKITPAGAVTTLAGGTLGKADGDGKAAQFNYPYALTLDALGNIYVADCFNNLVRKVTPTGTVTTIAGDGVAGFKDGVGKSAEFNAPSGIAMDADGNLYICDNNNERIRKITPQGLVKTFDYVFNGPQGIVLDADKNIYVVSTGNNVVYKIAPAGTVTIVAGDPQGGFANGPAASALFFYPEGLAMDAAGNLYVGDLGNNKIRKITASGMVSTVAGTTKGYKDGQIQNAEFYAPSGVAMDASGNIYVADVGNHSIRKIKHQDN